MRHKLTKKALSLLVTLAMLLSMVPVAYAAEETDTGENPVTLVEECTNDDNCTVHEAALLSGETVTHYGTLAEAITAANSEKADVKITLLNDVTLDTDLRIGSGSTERTITVDLNGKTIDGGTVAQVYTAGEHKIVFTGNGTITNENVGQSADYAPLRIYNGSSVELDGVTVSGNYCGVKNSGNLTVKKAIIGGTTFGIGCFGSGTTVIGQFGGNDSDIIVNAQEQALCSAGATGNPGMTVTVYNGTFTATGTEWDDCPAYWAGHGTLNVYGGIFKSDSAGDVAALYQKNGEVNIHGGTFEARNGIKVGAEATDSTEITLNIDGGTITGTRHAAFYFKTTASGNKCETYNIDISGGNFSGVAAKGAIYKSCVDSVITPTVIVTGGTYSSDPSEYVDTANYTVTDNADGTWTVQPAAPKVAEVNGATYKTLQEAINAATTAGDTVKLLRDVVETITIAAEQDVVLELNGKKLDGGSTTTTVITANGALTIQDTPDSGVVVGKLSKGTSGNITITGGTFNSINSLYWAEKCVAYKNDDSTYTIRSIGDNCCYIKSVNAPVATAAYPTIATAIEALPDSGYAIVLCENVTEDFTVPEGKSFTLDLAKYVLTGTITNNGTLMIKNIPAKGVSDNTIRVTLSPSAILQAYWSGSTRKKYFDSTNVTVPGPEYAIKTTYSPSKYYKYILEKYTISVAVDSETTYCSALPDAVTAAGTEQSAVITLLDDFLYTDGLTIPAGANITLDLNGHTLKTNNIYSQNIMVAEGAELTLKDSTDTEKNGTSTGSVYSYATGAGAGFDGLIHVEGTFNMESGLVQGVTGGTNWARPGVSVWGNGIINIHGGKINGGGYAITGNGSETGKTIKTEITIDGGILSSGESVAIYHPQDGTLTISGGTITGAHGIQMCSGTLNISGNPSITVTGADETATKSGAGPIPDGAAVSVVNRSGYAGIGSVTISGTPTLTAANGEQALRVYTWNATNKTTDEWIEGKNHVSLTGGTYSSNPSTYVKNNGTDYIVKRNGSEGSYTYTVTAKSGLTSGIYLSDPSGATASYNYVSKNSDGTWTVYYSAPSDSGSSGGTTTTPSQPAISQETKPDGSTVTTETKPDGTVTESNTSKPTTDASGNTSQTTTETTTGKDGVTESKTETVTKPDGSASSTTESTTTKPDGTTTESKTETTINKDGSTASTTTATTTNKDGTVTESKTEATTSTVTNKDGSTTETKQETTTTSTGSKTESTTVTTVNKDGSSTATTTATTTDKAGTVTESKTESTTSKNGTTTEVTVTTETKANGTVIESKTATTTQTNGSSSSTTTATTTKADGTTTTSKTTATTSLSANKSTGTVTETKKETTTTSDGVKSEGTTVTQIQKDGTVTSKETVKTSDSTGTTATKTTTLDAKGEVTTTAEAAVSAKAVTEAAKTGEAVTIPVEVAATKSTSTAPTVAVSVPKTAESVKVELPVQNVTSGTVAVIVHADGTEEIVKTSIPTEDGVALTVEGDVTVKVIDNSKIFKDVHPVDHWAQESIDFVSSRELFTGKTVDTFAPQDPTTRAQLMTVLARMDGADTSEKPLQQGMNWAVESGVSDGSNPNNTITRQQLAAMLYRYAGSPETNFELTQPDAGKVSDYAVDAMRWAVENGIIKGKTDGTLDPYGLATRAQVAAMMARYCNQAA